MGQFEYTARTADGRPITGSLEAADEKVALRLLSEKFELVTELKPVGGSRRRFRLFSPGMRSEELHAFTEQLAEMIESGISLTSGLEILLQDVENPARHAMLADILSSVNAGESFTSALSHHPRVFSPLYVAMVSAGEASGQLPLMLARLGTYLERSERIKRQIQASLVYPSIVFAFALVVVVVILVFGVPKVAEMYASMGAQLPWVTRTFVDVFTLLERWWFVWALLGGALLYAGSLLVRGPKGLLFLQNLAANLFPSLNRNIAMARFSRTLGTLYSSAVPLGEGLEMVSQAMGSPIMEAEVMDVRLRVMNGEPLSVAMRRSAAFPSLVVGMVAAGQESGALDRMLMKLADIYESKVDAGLRAAVSALEPLVIIVVGIMVAATLLILGLPFLNMGSLI